MLNQICQYLKNWFDEDSRHNRLPSWSGEITIEDGELVWFSDRLLEGQYFRIINSALNDGVYQYPAELKDETFDGAIQSMRVPPDVIGLVEDITAWIAANQTAINSPYSGESFGGYSYTLRSDGGGYDGAGASWQAQFRRRLNVWRKI